MGFLRRAVPVVLSLALTSAPLLAYQRGPAAPVDPALSQESRGPSTSEERAKVVQLTRQLERDPLGKGSREAREWLTVWIIQVPDITVQTCGSLLGPVESDKNKESYSAELQAQMMFSQAAFVIENPQATEDIHARLVASVEGALKVYEGILRKKPAARRPYLDDLLEKRSKGEVSAYVRDAMRSCR